MQKQRIIDKNQCSSFLNSIQCRKSVFVLKTCSKKEVPPVKHSLQGLTETRMGQTGWISAYAIRVAVQMFLGRWFFDFGKRFVDRHMRAMIFMSYAFIGTSTGHWDLWSGRKAPDDVVPPYISIFPHKIPSWNYKLTLSYKFFAFIRNSAYLFLDHPAFYNLRFQSLVSSKSE